MKYSLEFGPNDNVMTIRHDQRRMSARLLEADIDSSVFTNTLEQIRDIEDALGKMLLESITGVRSVILKDGDIHINRRTKARWSKIISDLFILASYHLPAEEEIEKMSPNTYYEYPDQGESIIKNQSAQKDAALNAAIFFELTRHKQQTSYQKIA